MTEDPEHRFDKMAVIALCALGLLILGGISWGAISYRIPNDSQTLLGVIVGGIMLFARECLQAIRSAWQEARTGKITDQLAGSAPPSSDAVQAVVVTNSSEDPVQTEQAR